MSIHQKCADEILGMCKEPGDPNAKIDAITRYCHEIIGSKTVADLPDPEPPEELPDPPSVAEPGAVVGGE